MQEKSDSKAIIGWAGTLAAVIYDLFFNYYIDKAMSTPDGGFLDYLNSATKYEGPSSLIFAAAILLMPLILFERKDKLERVVIPVNDDEDEDDDDNN